jgi:serine/threonine protein phosphatase 1
MTQPMFVVGDVHGSYDQLARLLDSKYPVSRHLVFIGDLIDRGYDSSKVLDLIVQYRNSWPWGVSVLRGNHEQALLEFLDSGEATQFLRNGGLTTVASYYKSVPPGVMQAFRNDFPIHHRSLLASTMTHIETANVLISHMGYDPGRPNARDLRAMVLEPHHELFRLATEGPVSLVVCGHYAQEGGRPFESASLVCIDTGCGTVEGAPLTAILLPERKIVQSSKEGQVK